ncbi:MAG: polyphosphate kinase 1 [Desulfovibrionaceae bacterium]|nr:polyphosphate kinase 1 [Desulfovibrionaceae bacterium]
MTEKKKKALAEDPIPDPFSEMDSSDCYINRELSWLQFNARVLETAENRRLPLLEQLKFLSIFHSNLDEFFMVRVAGVLHRYRETRAGAQDSDDGITPSSLLSAIRRQTLALLERSGELWKDLLPSLKAKGISLVEYDDLNEKQRRFALAFFRDRIYPLLTPQAIDPGHPFPTISNLSLNFIIRLQNQSGKTRFARLRCPDNVSRFVLIPRSLDNPDSAEPEKDIRNADILPLEELIKEHLSLLFPGYTLESCGMFRITRNSNIDLAEEEADNLLYAVRDMVNQRRFNGVVRLETSRGMPASLSELLVTHLNLKAFQIYRTKTPMAMVDFMDLYSAGRPGLKFSAYAQNYPEKLRSTSAFDAIREKDILLHHPYDTFEAVTDFIRQAAEDPDVVSIKQTLYRVGRNSPIVQSLIDARKSGKQVTAVVELKARFDETRNIIRAEELEKAGVNVVYGLAGLKIHAKLCLVVRRENGSIQSYAHIGTGNYNAATAQMYTDLGLLTCQPDICADIADLFNVMTGYAEKSTWRELLVSPRTMRSGLIEKIRHEIDIQAQGGHGEIIMKCNQLVDKTVIRALYMASKAGVKISLIVRGICCLRPGIPGLSENITVRSIVGRFLEHARVYYFGNDGNPCMYIGSADIMPRNLDRRIEVLTPILDEQIKKRIADGILTLQLQDNTRTWALNEKGSYVRIRRDRDGTAINAQEDQIRK